MSIRVRFNIKKALFFAFVFLLFVPCLVAQTNTTPLVQEPLSWVEKNLALLGLIISEAMAFLPAKTAGIIKAVYSLVEALFKKKST